MSYSNFKLSIDRSAFTVSNDNRHPEGLNLKEVPRDYSEFTKLLNSVGGPLGWDKRKKYRVYQSEVRQRLALEATHLFLFERFNKAIGYSLTIARPDLSKTFNMQVAEIENFGLKPAYTAKGYGGYFLNQVLSRLFNEGYEKVYLESRSTNHKKVVPFYERNGMSVIGIDEDIPDDFTP